MRTCRPPAPRNILTVLVALATAPRLPLCTTKVGHVCVRAVGARPIYHKLLMYGAFALLPVNALLALRCTNSDLPPVGALACSSLALYAPRARGQLGAQASMCSFNLDATKWQAAVA